MGRYERAAKISLKEATALASGVILTTITDVFGFLSFLGLASILLI